MSVIDFPGNGAKDVTINKGNPPPTASKGGSPDVKWAGKGGTDVDYNNIQTKSGSGGAQTSPIPPKPTSGGPIKGPMD